jgi:hypothetical protein
MHMLAILGRAARNNNVVIDEKETSARAWPT